MPSIATTDQPALYAPQLNNANVGVGTSADTAALRGTVSDILGLQAKAATDNANAGASDIQATGYQQEAGAYGTVGAIAENQAVTAGVAGDIKALQERRQLGKTLGSQRADVASAGFSNSGSAVGIFRDSVQQGALARQLNRVQTSITQGGYLEEGAAAAAEQAGATMASTAATNLAMQQRASGQLATASAASETAALSGFVATSANGKPLNSEQTLALGTLGALPDVQGPAAGTVFDPATLPASGVTLPIPAPLPGATSALSNSPTFNANEFTGSAIRQAATSGGKLGI